MNKNRPDSKPFPVTQRERDIVERNYRDEHRHRPERAIRVEVDGKPYRALVCAECGKGYHLTPWADRPNPRGIGPQGDHR